MRRQIVNDYTILSKEYGKNLFIVQKQSDMIGYDTDTGRIKDQVKRTHRNECHTQKKMENERRKKKMMHTVRTQST